MRRVLLRICWFFKRATDFARVIEEQFSGIIIDSLHSLSYLRVHTHNQPLRVQRWRHLKSLHILEPVRSWAQQLLIEVPRCWRPLQRRHDRLIHFFKLLTEIFDRSLRNIIIKYSGVSNRLKFHLGLFQRWMQSLHLRLRLILYWNAKARLASVLKQFARLIASMYVFISNQWIKSYRTHLQSRFLNFSNHIVLNIIQILIWVVIIIVAAKAAAIWTLRGVEHMLFFEIGVFDNVILSACKSIERTVVARLVHHGIVSHITRILGFTRCLESSHLRHLRWLNWIIMIFLLMVHNVRATSRLLLELRFVCLIVFGHLEGCVDVFRWW